MARMYSLTIRNRAAAAALAVAVVGVGAIMLTVGLALLAGLAVTGAVVGTGYAIYNRVRGRKASALPGYHRPNASGLDPSMEIRPIEGSVIRQIGSDESAK